MYASTTHEFKEGVFVVHTFQKNVKKLCTLKFLLQALPSKIEEVMQIEQMRISNKWEQTQINIKEWWPARA